VTFKDAVACCHVRSAIYRTSKPEVRYWKNNPLTLEQQVRPEERKATDWQEYDPREGASASEAMA